MVQEMMATKAEKHNLIKYYEDNLVKQKLDKYRETKIQSAKRDRSQQLIEQESDLLRKQRQIQKAIKIQQVLENRIKQKISYGVYQSMISTGKVLLNNNSSSFIKESE